MSKYFERATCSIGLRLNWFSYFLFSFRLFVLHSHLSSFPSMLLLLRSGSYEKKGKKRNENLSAIDFDTSPKDENYIENDKGGWDKRDSKRKSKFRILHSKFTHTVECGIFCILCFWLASTFFNRLCCLSNAEQENTKAFHFLSFSNERIFHSHAPSHSFCMYLVYCVDYYYYCFSRFVSFPLSVFVQTTFFNFFFFFYYFCRTTLVLKRKFLKLFSKIFVFWIMEKRTNERNEKREK